MTPEEIKKTLIITEALCIGLPVQLNNGCTYTLDENRSLRIVGHNVTTGKAVLLHTFEEFPGALVFNVAEFVSDDEITSLAATIALNKLHSNGR